MKNWFRKIMAGRYGVDQLSYFLLILSLILYVLTLPISSGLIRLIALIPLFLCYYRIFSKKLYKRQQENFKFIRFYTPILKRGRTRLTQIKEIKTHKYFNCPKCHQILRVPRHKGNITITCPKCKNTFHQHS